MAALAVLVCTLVGALTESSFTVVGSALGLASAGALLVRQTVAKAVVVFPSAFSCSSWTGAAPQRSRSQRRCTT